MEKNEKILGLLLEHKKMLIEKHRGRKHCASLKRGSQSQLQWNMMSHPYGFEQSLEQKCLHKRGRNPTGLFRQNGYYLAQF